MDTTQRPAHRQPITLYVRSLDDGRPGQPIDCWVHKDRSTASRWALMFGSGRATMMPLEHIHSWEPRNTGGAR